MHTKVIFSSLSFVLKYHLSRAYKVWSPLCHPIVPFKLSDIGEGIREVTVRQSFIKPEQRLTQFQNVCEVESDKAAVTITSRFDGQVKTVYFNEGDVISVGSTLCDIDVQERPDEDQQLLEQDTLTVSAVQTEEGTRETVQFVHVETKPPTHTPPEPNSQQSIASAHSEKALATPAVRRLAREYNVDTKLLDGTGKGGRITKEDILNHLNQPTPKLTNVPTFSTADKVVQLVSGYQKVMVRTMTESNRIPALGLSDEIDVTEIEAMRKSIKTDLQSEDVKLTLLAFLIKAISLALERYPILNAVFENDSITYKNVHNIGIAVDTATGLVVPNIKNVQQLSVRNVAREIQRLQTLAAASKLSLADTSNCTFSISNIGAIAGTVAKPLILPPQVAIVAIGRIQALPRYDENDLLRKRLVLTASWAADHRIIDGGTMGRFSNLIKRYLEKPAHLILDS